MSDYLFDKQGEPDPEIAHLEQVLRPLAYRGAPPPPPRRSRVRVWISAGALAAAAVALILVMRPKPVPWIEATGPHTILRIGELGTVDLEPGTRARLVENGPRQYRVQLDHGTLSAVIHAPPRQFIVETTRLRVVDLGCAFKLTVDAAGVGTLVVTEGKVAVSAVDAPEVVVPAGASSALTDHGPAAPVFPHEPAPVPVPVPVPTPTPAPAPAPAPAPKPKTKAVHKHVTPQLPPHVPQAPPEKKAPPMKKTDDGFKHDAFKDLP